MKTAVAVGRDLSRAELDIYSMCWFNNLHSISRTRGEFLVSSTGLGLLVDMHTTHINSAVELPNGDILLRPGLTPLFFRGIEKPEMPTA